MKKFEIGDRLFDARYGWGDLVDIDDRGYHYIKFDKDNFNSCFSSGVAIKVLSYAEYDLKDYDESKTTWHSIYKEWYHYSDLKYREFLEQNFEPPVRKCK